MWYPGSGDVLIVSIPDLCHLSYFYKKREEVWFLLCIIFAAFCSKFVLVYIMPCFKKTDLIGRRFQVIDFAF